MSGRLLRTGAVAGVLALGAVLAACDTETQRPGDREDAAGAHDEGAPATPRAADSGGARGSAESGVAVVSVAPGGFPVPGPGAAAIGPALPGLTVRGSANLKVPADVAFLTVLTVSRGGPLPFTQVRAEDQARIVEGLAPLGVAKGDVSFGGDPRFGPFGVIAVRVPAARAARDGNAILDVIERVQGRGESRGVVFALGDCVSALRPAREGAFRAAEAHAKSVAAAAGLTLGPVIAVSDAPQTAIYGPPTADPCNADPASAVSGKGPAALGPVDGPAELSVDVSLSVTYALAGGTGASGSDGLTAIGSGRVKVKADEAYVVVLTETAYGPGGPRPLATKDRDAVTAKLTGLGIKKNDIEFGQPGFGGPVFVSVEVAVKDLPRIGRDVERSVEDVLGRVQQGGVRFSHSNCTAVLAEARKAAVADAKARAESLASAAGVRLGALRSVAEAPAGGANGAPVQDPCDDSASAFFAYGPGGLQPYEAPAEMTASVAVALTYALTP